MKIIVFGSWQAKLRGNAKPHLTVRNTTIKCASLCLHAGWTVNSSKWSRLKVYERSQRYGLPRAPGKHTRLAKRPSLHVFNAGNESAYAGRRRMSNFFCCRAIWSSWTGLVSRTRNARGCFVFFWMIASRCPGNLMAISITMVSYNYRVYTTHSVFSSLIQPERIF